MGDFFRGWRRKIGCVTLLLACLFATGWIRSQIVADVIMFHCGPRTTGIVYSVRNCLSLTSRQDGVLHSEVSIPIWHESSIADFPDPAVVDHFEWQCPKCGSSFLVGGEVGLLARFSHVPYWSIVIPLTLLSAFLLLTKLRQSNETKMAEPTPAEGP